MVKTKKWLPAVGAGLVAAIAQYLLQPLPALVMGYEQESGSLTLAPTWTSWWWALSAVFLGVGVAIGRAVIKRWTAKAFVLFVILCVVGFYVANQILVAPYLTSEWWALPLVAATFTGAAPLAGAISAFAGVYFRRKGPRYYGRTSPEGR